MKIKAFLVNTSIVLVGDIAPLGELSTYVRTFGRNTQDVQLPISPDLSLVLFDDTAVPEEALVIVNKVIVAMLRETSQITVGDYDATVLTRKITATIGITGLRIGNVLAHNEHRGVTHMTFEVLRTAEENDTVTIYYSDQTMRSMDSDVEYLVLPPTDIANLELPYSDLTQLQYADTVTALQTVTEPYTSIQRVDVIIHAIDDTTLTVTVPFYTVAWGAHGNIDYKVRDAIRTYILSNTTSDSAWVSYFAPELWTTNLFYLFPKWTDAPLDGTDGSYSSIADIAATVSHITAGTGYGSVYVKEKMELFTVSYKNLMVSSVPSPGNSTNSTRLLQIVPDYLSDADNNMFNKQSETTKAWSVMIHDLAAVAEGAYVSDVETDIITTRGIVDFYTASTNGVTYSMAKR